MIRFFHNVLGKTKDARNRKETDNTLKCEITLEISKLKSKPSKRKVYKLPLAKQYMISKERRKSLATCIVHHRGVWSFILF